MKKGLLLMVALIACFALAIQAAPVKNNIPVDGNYIANTAKAPAGKVPAGSVVVGPTGFADAWRTPAGMQGKSIIASPSGDSIMILYATFSGNSGRPSTVLWAYSEDGGSSWSQQTIVDTRNSRTYSGMAVDNAFTPYIVWQDRLGNPPWQMLTTYDEGGFGSGLWSTPTVLTDSAAFYLPSIDVDDDGSNFTLMTSAFPHYSFGYDASIYMARTTDRTMGTWDSPWDLSGTWGWKLIFDAPWDDQDNVDWIFEPGGNTVIAFWEQVPDTIVTTVNGYRYFPMYAVSTDKGVTWGPQTILFTGADTLPPQYTDGGWWYRFDGLWAGDRPHLLFSHGDGVWNGSAMFEYHPTVAGDYTNWTCNRVSAQPENLDGVNNGDLFGSFGDWPNIVKDESGNLFVTYVEYVEGSNSFSDIFGVASTDGGETWLTPVNMTNDTTYFEGWGETAELAGGNNIHMMITEYDLMDTMRYLSFPTATLLAAPARPREIDVAPKPGLQIGGFSSGGPATDGVLDTVLTDSVMFSWSPSVAFGGTYELTISKTADWSDGANIYDYHIQPNVNYTGTIGGLPSAGVWYWKVRSHKGGEMSPWSEVFDFEYVGTLTSNTTDWVNPSGVTGNLVSVTHPFALNQNRPNPVNGNTAISFSLPKAGEYSLKVYNVAGQVVNTINGRGAAGMNTVNWNSKGVSNGVYFYQLSADNKTATKKLVVVK